MRNAILLSGLVLGALPMVASAHDSVRLHVGLPVPSIGIGFGHHHHDCGPVFGACLPSVYVGGAVTCEPAVVAAPVIAEPVYVPPAPVIYTQPAVVYTTPVVYSRPVYFGAPLRVYGRPGCVAVRGCR